MVTPGPASALVTTEDTLKLPAAVRRELEHYTSQLPQVIHYFDEYDETERSIRAGESQWHIRLNGSSSSFRVGSLESTFRDLLHGHAAVGLPSAPTGTRDAFGHLLAHPELLQRTAEAAVQGPLVGLSFARSQLGELAPHEWGFTASKALLRAMAHLEWFGWSEDDLHALRGINNPLRSSPNPLADGTALLSLEEQRAIHEHFEELAVHLSTDVAPAWQELRAASMLYWNYSNGVRPIQIAKLNVEDVRVRPGSSDHPTPTVVVRVPYVKQRRRGIKKYSPRRMRRTWTPIMAAWMKRRSDPGIVAGFDRAQSLFGLPPQSVSREITRYVTQITGVRRTPYDMRHTAAQRLADIGANRLTIAEFLTHEDINTANAYIENSPSQAEIINQALGQSPVFRKLDAEMKRRSISTSEHARLEPDNQVMDTPNGHPIVGIGGCALGQSFCTKTPALACYTCPKFMFLRDDVEVHRNALSAARRIVQEFLEASPTGRNTPAFVQLRQTIEVMQAVIADIEGDRS